MALRTDGAPARPGRRVKKRVKPPRSPGDHGPIREPERKRLAAQRKTTTHRIKRGGREVESHRKPTGAPRTMALPPAVARGDRRAVNQYLRDVRRAEQYNQRLRKHERVLKRQGLGYHGQEAASGRAEPGGLTGGLYTGLTKPVLTIRSPKGGGYYGKTLKVSPLDVATAVPVGAATGLAVRTGARLAERSLGRLAARAGTRGRATVLNSAGRPVTIRFAKKGPTPKTAPQRGGAWGVDAEGRAVWHPGAKGARVPKRTHPNQGPKLGAGGRPREGYPKTKGTHAPPDVVEGLKDLGKFGRIPYEKYRVRELSKRLGKYSLRHPFRAGGLGYAGATVGVAPIAATDNTGSLPEWLRLATVPTELVKAAAEDPSGFASATGLSAKSMIAGIPVGVAYAVQPAHWDNVVEMMKDDLSRRYGPLLAGDSAKFRRIARENGLTPYFIDALAAGGGSSQIVGRLGSAGALGRGFQNWMTRARPDLRVTSAGHARRQRPSHGVAGRAGQHFLDWARRHRQATRRPGTKFMSDLSLAENEVPALTRWGGSAARKRQAVQAKARSTIAGTRLKHQINTVLAKVPKATNHIPRNLRNQTFKEIYIHGVASPEQLASVAARRARMVEGERSRLGYVPPPKPDEVPKLKQISQHPEYYTPELRAVADEVRNTVEAIGDLDPALYPEQMVERMYAPLAQLLGPELLPPAGRAPGPGGLGGSPGPGPRQPLDPTEPDLGGEGLTIEEIQSGLRHYDERRATPAATPEEAFPGLIRTDEAGRGNTAASNAYGELGKRGGGRYNIRMGKADLFGGMDAQGRPIEPRIRDHGASRESLEGIAGQAAREGGSVAPGQPGYTRRGEVAQTMREAGVPEDEIQGLLDDWEQTLREIDQEFDGPDGPSDSDIAMLENEFDAEFGDDFSQWYSDEERAGFENTADQIAGLPETGFDSGPIPRDEIPGLETPRPRQMTDEDLARYIEEVQKDIRDIDAATPEELDSYGIGPEDIQDVHDRFNEAEAEQARRQGAFERDVEHDIENLPDDQRAEAVAPMTERAARAEQLFGEDPVGTDWLDDENFLTMEGLDELGFRGSTPDPDLIRWPEALKAISAGRGQGTVVLRQLFDRPLDDLSRTELALRQAATVRTQRALARDKVPDPVTLYRHEPEHPEGVVDLSTGLSMTDRRKHANDHARSAGEEPNVKSTKVSHQNIRIYSEAFPEIFHRNGVREGEREFIAAVEPAEVPERDPRLNEDEFTPTNEEDALAREAATTPEEDALDAEYEQNVLDNLDSEDISNDLTEEDWRRAARAAEAAGEADWVEQFNMRADEAAAQGPPEQPPGSPPPAPPGGVPPLGYGGSGGHGDSFGPFPPEDLGDVIDEAARQGHVTPGYFPSQITPRLRQGGSRDVNFQFAGPMQYTGKLYRLGIEDPSLDTLRRGVYANIDRRQAWNNMARQLEDNAEPYRGPITSQWSEMQRDGLNPKDYMWVSQRKLLADVTDKDVDFAAAVSQNSGTPGSLPTHFKTDRSLVAIHKSAWDGMIDPPGRLRGVNNVNRFLKTKASRVILGSLNLPWLQFQVLSNVAMTGLAKTGPLDIVKAQLWWRRLTDEQRAAVEPYLGQGHFAWDVDTPQLLPESNNRFINAYRAFKQTSKGQRIAKFWPLNWMFKADHAQNAFFRRSVLHSQIKRQAYQQMNRNAGKMQGAQERLTNVFKLGPKEQMDHIIRNPKLMEEHASYVNDFLGDYLSFTPHEREWLASNVMFYAFLRFSLKLTFYTMPVRHPTMTAVLGKLGAMDPQETRKMLGDGVLPYQLGKFFFQDGKTVMDLSRANPALSAVTQSSTPLQIMASMLPPHVSMLLFTQGAAIIPYTGGKVRVGGKTQPVTPDTWGALDPTRAKVLARQTLSLFYPYRVVERVLAKGEPLGADHLVFAPAVTKYKRADIVASVNRDKRNVLSQSTGRRVANEIIPFLTRPSREREIAKSRVKRGRRTASPGGAPGLGGSSSGGGKAPGL